MGYTPAGVPAGTDTLPVNGSSNGTGAPATSGVAGVTTAKVALPEAPKVGATPFTVSLVNALPTLGLPIALLGAEKLSVVAANVESTTVIVTVVSLQLIGLALSHSL